MFLLTGFIPTTGASGTTYKVAFYDEDTLDPIDWSSNPYKAMTAKLVVHYQNATDIYYVNQSTTYYDSDIGARAINVSTSTTPRLFEVVWNYRWDYSQLDNDSNAYVEYRRFLTPYVADSISGKTVIKFYMSTLSVYNTYYIYKYNSTTLEYRYDYDMANSIVVYTYDYDDRTTEFATDSNALTSIYIYDSSNNKVYIDQQYWDATKRTYPALEYGKGGYYIGLNCSMYDLQDYGLAPNQEDTNPTILVTAEKQLTPFQSLMTVRYYYKSDADTGVWVFYETKDDRIPTVNVSLYDVDSEELVDEKGHTGSTFNFTFSSANQSHSFYIHFNATYSSTEAYSVTFYLYPGVNYTKISSQDLNDLIVSIIGLPPVYNVETNQPVSYVSLFILLSALFVFGALVRVNEGLSIIASGITIITINTFIGGLDTLVYIGGVLITLLGVIWLTKGGSNV